MPTRKLPLSPMLVQYLVGLCALNWHPNAVNVTIGNMVPDEASGTERDVDVTVTVDTPDGVYAFKGYEVKNWATPLDVADVEALAVKLNDMPSVTHRAIVSPSGFYEPAVKKAEYHKVDLYTITKWTKPLDEQFPDLAPMSGLPEEVFRTFNFVLQWMSHNIWLTCPGAPDFTLQPDDMLFDSVGVRHELFAEFRSYSDAMLVRSTGILWGLEPLRSLVIPMVEAARAGQQVPEPQWPYAHTLDVARDGVHLRIADTVYQIDTITVYGEVRWHRMPAQYYVMEKVPSGETFAGALIAQRGIPGQMTAIIVPAQGRDLLVQDVQLEQRHLNSIKELKLALPEDNS
jgi:hypothetical protein